MWASSWSSTARRRSTGHSSAPPGSTIVGSSAPQQSRDDPAAEREAEYEKGGDGEPKRNEERAEGDRPRSTGTRLGAIGRGSRYSVAVRGRGGRRREAWIERTGLAQAWH